MNDFKPGDRVKVEFEGEIGAVSRGYSDRGLYSVGSYLIYKDHITLLERAKPKLEVGQVYRFILHEIKIVEIGKMVVGAENLTTGKNIALLKSDFDDRIELITEGENG